MDFLIHILAISAINIQVISTSEISMGVCNRWTGELDWSTGLEHWTGVLEHWSVKPKGLK